MDTDGHGRTNERTDGEDSGAMGLELLVGLRADL